jgi:hypothetical protein
MLSAAQVYQKRGKGKDSFFRTFPPLAIIIGNADARCTVGSAERRSLGRPNFKRRPQLDRMQEEVRLTGGGRLQ